MTGILTYFPTLAFIPHYAFALTFIYAVLRRNDIIINHFSTYAKVKSNFIILLLIAFLSVVNCFIGIVFYDSEPGFPYPVLLLATYFIALSLTKTDLKIIFWLAFAESIVVIAEFASGTSSFIPQFASTGNPDTDLLYFSRPMGLSYNSSIVAYKLLVAILIAEYLDKRSLLYRIAQVVLLTGIILTFSRTILVVLVIYFAIRYSHHYLISFIELLKFRIKYRNLVFIIAFSAFIGVSFYFVYSNFSSISTQFTRGKGNIEFSGREKIWPQFVEFIKENPISGNHSLKYYADYHGIADSAHAHNSFLQVLADNGIFIFALYMIFVFANINRKNVYYILPILIYSITQYGVFWGISLLDIVFMMILLRKDEELTMLTCKPIRIL